MHKKILLTLLAAVLTLIYTVNIASAINLGHTVFDNEIPETMSESTFDPENPGINFGLCAGFSDIPEEDCYLTPEQIKEIVEYEEPEIIKNEIEETPQSKARVLLDTSSEPEPPATSVAQVVINEIPAQPAQPPQEPEEEENPDTPKVLGTSIGQENIAQKNMELELDDLKTQITFLQRKINNRGADFTAEILIFLVIVLSILSLRTEVKFQQLADRYDKLKNTIVRNTLIKKIKQKRKPKETNRD